MSALRWTDYRGLFKDERPEWKQCLNDKTTHCCGKRMMELSVCVCVCRKPDNHLCIVMSRPACVCANASMHVCDWTPIARLWSLKPLLSPALILPTH